MSRKSRVDLIDRADVIDRGGSRAASSVFFFFFFFFFFFIFFFFFYFVCSYVDRFNSQPRSRILPESVVSATRAWAPLVDLQDPSDKRRPEITRSRTPPPPEKPSPPLPRARYPTAPPRRDLPS